ncbi:DUF3667 domain-containing protein [Chitinophaga vietnamensis]|uniref:DUF3667 domain-containing protein n=1 Tax=Chitinophaga vietnamensis TaxID=2593957 RepID=UPI0013759AC8|nr:DUF3667 domain-containing protein [Chitinophaga vietnamensis]
MKLHSLRKEKDCLNCGAEVLERFCPHCGQENTVTHETFSHLAKHFVADIFHYDSQFFKTLKYLLFRPGYLTREYTSGKRLRYVNPIKLYVFVSFVFFFAVFALQHEDKKHKHKEVVDEFVDNTVKNTAATTGKKYPADTVDVAANPAGFSKKLVKDIAKDIDTTKSDDEFDDVMKSLDKYETVGEFEAAQAKLPDSLRMKGSHKIVAHRLMDLKERYSGDDGEDVLKESFKHNIPKFMFFMLPLFAMFMLWMYRRSGKWLYSDHAIFTIHFHAFTYMLFLVAALLKWAWPQLDFYGWAFLGMLIYLIAALHNYYKQGWLKSALKGFLLIFTYLIAMGIVFTLLVIIMFAVVI